MVPMLVGRIQRFGLGHADPNFAFTPFSGIQMVTHNITLVYVLNAKKYMNYSKFNPNLFDHQISGFCSNQFSQTLARTHFGSASLNRKPHTIPRIHINGSVGRGRQVHERHVRAAVQLLVISFALFPTEHTRKRKYDAEKCVGAYACMHSGECSPRARAHVM